MLEGCIRTPCTSCEINQTDNGPIIIDGFRVWQLLMCIAGYMIPARSSLFAPPCFQFGASKSKANANACSQDLVAKLLVRSHEKDNLLGVRLNPTIWAPYSKFLSFGAVDLIFSRQSSYEFVVVAIVCTAGIFFFPAVGGPYSAVHGPVTVLQSIKAKFQLMLVMALAAFYVLGFRLPSCDAILRALRRGAALPRSSPLDRTSTLRC